MVVNIWMKTAISRLTKLGLTDYEARAYTALLKENPATAYEIAKLSGIPSSKIYEVIERLVTKGIAQSTQAERAKLFIPIAPEELIQGFRTTMNDDLQAAEAELRGIRTGIETSFTWHLRDYNNFILRGRRMIETAKKTILLMVWEEEMEAMSSGLTEARHRGTDIAIVHYGVTSSRMAQLYIHPIEETMYEEKHTRGFTLIADAKEMLTARIDDPERIEAVWSMNEALVMLAEDYLRHDIYFLKTAKRLAPLLKEKFGQRYEKLRNLFRDD